MEIDWAFDCKDGGYFSGDSKPTTKKQMELTSKFGNFNTPIVIKLCSKYNKSVQAERMRAEPRSIAQLVVERLNLQLGVDEADLTSKDESAAELRTQLQIYASDIQRWPLVYSEVKEFSELNGFINVFLVNPSSQFADRVQVTLKKKRKAAQAAQAAYSDRGTGSLAANR